jgi:putative pyruvate formate lyase activating enzyme
MKEVDHKKITRRSFLEKTAKLSLSLGLSRLSLVSGEAEATSNTGTDFEPAYLKLHKTGELKERADELWAIMKRCQLCPRRCRVNRHKGTSGFCHAPGTTLITASAHPHFGEERPLVGKGGSGTIFLSHCNLRCVFCQNFDIAQLGAGSETTIDEFAGMMLQLQEIGCHNINIVTPTHYSAHILKAIDIAAGQGLRLPIVYNTSGWERLEILKMLDGIVDIYLPDFKYWDSDMSSKYSSEAESYPEITGEAILEMHRQVGVAKPAKDGIMQRGLMIRHLVMPNNIAGSENVMEWIAGNLPKDTYVNIMVQYNPVYKAYDYPEISRRITKEEYIKVVNKAKGLGLTNLDTQGYWWLKG